MSDLTGSEIREAVTGFKWGMDEDGRRYDAITEAALAYADLLEKAEKVWWCRQYDDLYRHGQVCDRDTEEPQEPGLECGWVLLVRGEQ